MSPRTTEDLTIIKLNRQAIIDFKENHKIELGDKILDDAFKLVEVRIETPNPDDEDSNVRDYLDDDLEDEFFNDSDEEHDNEGSGTDLEEVESLGFF